MVLTAATYSTIKDNLNSCPVDCSNSAASSNSTTFYWQVSDWSTCSVPCNGGLQTRDVVCHSAVDGRCSPHLHSVRLLHVVLLTIHAEGKAGPFLAALCSLSKRCAHTCSLFYLSVSLHAILRSFHTCAMILQGNMLADRILPSHVTCSQTQLLLPQVLQIHY